MDEISVLQRVPDTDIWVSVIETYDGIFELGNLSADDPFELSYTSHPVPCM